MWWKLYKKDIKERFFNYFEESLEYMNDFFRSLGFFILGAVFLVVLPFISLISATAGLIKGKK